MIELDVDMEYLNGDDLKHVVLHDECGEHESVEYVRKDRCLELQAENDKLRAERDEWHRVAMSKQDIIDHMRDARTENVKLRELVRDMWREGAFEPGACYVREAIGLEERARELGIEVGL